MILQAAQLVDPSTVSGDKAPLIFFGIFTFIVLGGAINTVRSTNMVAAVMSLVATFFGLAALYAMLSAHFLAVLQVLVYAGAIMVLFIFVVMVLNKEEPEAPLRGPITKVFGLVALLYIGFKLTRYLELPTQTIQDVKPEFGTVANVGEILFNDYLFAFEAVSILLLIAVIAAVVVARIHHRPEPGAEPAATPAAEGSSH